MAQNAQALIAPEDPGPETLRVPVLKVFDGDGFLTKIAVPAEERQFEVTIRFGFIDAPEMEQPGGPEARDFLCSLIGGRWVELLILTKMDTGGSFDRHGRLVAVPYLVPDRPAWGIARWVRSDSLARNIELEMLLNGWAWLLERYCPDQRYYDALDEAQRHRRGIWASDENINPWEFKKRKYQSRRPRPRPPQKMPLFSEGVNRVPCPQENCGGVFIERVSQYGPFYGCSKFPECRYRKHKPTGWDNHAG